MADHQDLPGARGRGHGPLGVGGARGERLLHEAVLARLGHGDSERRMGGHRGGEDDRVELGVVQQLLEIAGRPRAGKTRCELLARLLGGVTQPCQLTASERAEVAREIWAPVAQAGDADADGLVLLLLLLAHHGLPVFPCARGHACAHMRTDAQVIALLPRFRRESRALLRSARLHGRPRRAPAARREARCRVRPAPLGHRGRRACSTLW